MGTTALSTLHSRLAQSIADFIEVNVTTAIANDKNIVSTDLNAYDNGEDDKFNTRWVYVTDYNNCDEDRYIHDYTTSTGTLAVRGDCFTSDSSDKATVRIGRYSYTMIKRAINDAIRELYPNLHRPLEDRTLITGQILPDNSFELWASSSNPSLYSGSASATLTRTTTAGYIRGALGTTSMNVSAGAANQYAYISSDEFPQLLDLMDTSINMSVYAYPSTADDAFMDVVYTLAGTSTTTSTTTTCGASRFTKLERDSIAIPDGIEKIEFRFRVLTSGEDAYFDSARVNGKALQEYLLLSDFSEGNISQVYIQVNGDYDDLQPTLWQKIYDWRTYDDGTYKWLQLLSLYPDDHQLRIIGTAPLSTVSDYTDTIEIDGGEIDLLIAYAAYRLFLREEGVPASQDKNVNESRAMQWLSEYYRLLPSLRMSSPTMTMRLPRY